MELQENGQISKSSMDPNLMGWVVHYIGIWVLNLAPSLDSGAIFHQGKIYWAWLCARQCAWCPAVLHFSRPSFSLAIISQLFSPFDLPIIYSSSSLIADDLSPHLVEKTEVSRRELAPFLPTTSTQPHSACPLVIMNELPRLLCGAKPSIESCLSSAQHMTLTILLSLLYSLYWDHFQYHPSTSLDFVFTSSSYVSQLFWINSNNNDNNN